MAFFYIHAGCYADGIRGMPQDWVKANELWLKAGDLGCADAYFNLGNSYTNGMGAEVDEKKAKHYYELAAMKGETSARHNLGCIEGQVGNHQRAFKHFILAARVGHTESLDVVKKGFRNEYVTKMNVQVLYVHTMKVKLR